MKWIVPLAVCAWSHAARADRPSWIEPAVAAHAEQELVQHPTMIRFCEPCGDKVPGTPAPVRKVVTRSIASYPGRSEVVVDGSAIDLAYTYVQTSEHRYENLAARVGAEAPGVSPTLRVDDETPSGVLIYADQTPVTTTLPPPPPPPPPAPAPPAAPTTIYVISNTTTGVGWLPIVLACGGTSMIWSLGAFAMTRRRRRDLEPRATRLLDR